jgi:hypothetical protein
MRYRIPVSLVILTLVWAASMRATTSAVASARQQAVFYLTEPTLIGSTIVKGPVLFTHDETKMARGEPCTTVYLVEPGKGPAEAVASFHCIPTRRAAVGTFTITTRPNAALGFGCVLTEYQFAGDTEAHGVPVPVLVDVSSATTGGT